MMILLWLALIVSSVHSDSLPHRHIGHIPNYTEYYNYCINKGTENRTSWLVAIHNLDTGKHFNGALISDRHLLTIKDAVTSIERGVERVTYDFASQLDLQAVTDDHKLVTLKAKHVIIPVEYNERTKQTRMLDLAIVELDSPAPDGVNFVCPNSRMHNTPNYPPCKGTEWNIDDECDKLLKGYRFSTYTRTFTDTTWGSNYAPFPDHSNFTRSCWHAKMGMDGMDHVWRDFECYSLWDQIMHNYLNQSEGGEEGLPGDVFVSGTLSHWNDTLHGLTVDQLGFAQLHGLGINETSVINLHHWEAFICEHTGVCFLGELPPNDPSYGDHDLAIREAISINERPYLIDGALVLKRCTEESIEKTNPLKPSEYRSISTNCGHKEDHEEWPVSILRPSENGSDPVHICTGSFISRRHVITSKSCVIPHMHRSLSIRYGPKKGYFHWFAAEFHSWFPGYYKNEPEYYNSDVRFVIYPGRIGTGSERYEDIAVLELTESIATTNNSMIMCLPERGHWALGHWHTEVDESGLVWGTSDDLFTMQWFGYENRNDSVTARLFEFDDILKSTVKSKYGNIDFGSPLVKSFPSKADKESGKNTTTLWAVTTDPSTSPFLIYVQNNIGLVCRMSGVCPAGAFELSRNEDMDIYANGKRLDCV